MNMTIFKIMRYFSYPLQNRLFLRQQIDCFNHCRNLYNSPKLHVKIFMEHENNFAYSIMQDQGYAIEIDSSDVSIVPKESLQELLSQTWSKKTHKEVIEIFPLLGAMCSKQGLCISNTMFDNFIDSLTDKLSHASDAELQSVFYSLVKWPETESVRTRNYIEVWAALDDECLKRIPQWSTDKMLNFASLFYMLNVSRISDYSHKCLLKLAFKAKSLSPEQIVKTMFFIGVRRYSPKDVHNLEIAVINKFNEFTIDELAIISMGFFKSKTPIRNMDLVNDIINKVMENVSHIHEISLTAILKVIRYSMKISTDEKIYSLLDKLRYEVPRLSVTCNVHVGLLGTATLTLHGECLDAIAKRVNASMHEARLKDLERLALIFGTFNYKPQSQDFFQNIVCELKNPEREKEIDKYGRSFACCLAYLCLSEIYPEDLFQKALNRKFLEKTYGKHCINYGREILTIHNIVQLFCNNCSQITDKEALVMAKKYTDYVPDPNYPKQYNVTDKMFLDVLTILKEVRGSELVTGGHIVTHHQRGDVIVCNSPNGTALPVGNSFDNKYFGSIIPLPNDNIWIVLIIVGRNVVIRNTQKATGPFKCKLKELRTLGYCAEMVLWDKYNSCETKEAKITYLNTLIQQAVQYRSPSKIIY